MHSFFARASITLALLATCVLAGCSNEEVEILRGVQLSTNGVAVCAEGGTKEITVTAYPEDEAWQVVVDNEEEWFDISTHPNTITVTVKRNDNTEPRRASFSVVSPEGHFEPYALTITQEAAGVATLTTNAPELFEVDSEASSYTFVVESNTAWETSSTAEWASVTSDNDAMRMTIAVEQNATDDVREAEIIVTTTATYQPLECRMTLRQAPRSNNAYYKLVGSWEITAPKWFYSPNGSLNSLDYAPNPSDYYLIFNIEEGVYGESLIMSDFLYPGTQLEVRYDSTTGGFTIPFGWTVLSYDVFLYVTLVSSTSFSYAAVEVDVEPNSDVTVLTPDMPQVDGYNYVGFGLWTYDENGNKEALGSNYMPTMFPMGDIEFRKRDE
ncbi:MAG: BACON domain-containing protein [Alistipes sp.]|nr:BACON domain-containing protein [Alistipes sp.]